MSPGVYAVFQRVMERFIAVRGGVAGAVIEVGAASDSLLTLPSIAQWKKTALNPIPFDTVPESLLDAEVVVGSSHDMSAWADATFDCIMSCSVLEHDRHFWISIDEMYRVLRPGGLCVLGVPIFMTLPTDVRNTTLTFRRHGLAYNADFYRYSQQAAREVLMHRYSEVQENLVRRYPNPYLVISGTKPLDAQ